MNSKKLIAAVVAASTLLVCGLGVALWSSPAEATGSIRKYSGPLPISNGGFFNFEVRVHNPHPSYTFRPSVVVRHESGGVHYNQEHPVAPHQVVTAYPVCFSVCTVEVNMTNAILQPSIYYFSQITGTHQYVYSGDFSR